MRNKALLCLLLALSLLAGPAAQAVKWEYPVSDHPEVDYEDMLPVTGFDETELVAALEELESVCGPQQHPVRRRGRRAGGGGLVSGALQPEPPAV